MILKTEFLEKFRKLENNLNKVNLKCLNLNRDEINCFGIETDPDKSRTCGVK